MNTNPPQKKRLAFIVHDEHNVPRYYQINKTLLKIILISLPAISILSIALIFSGLIYYHHISKLFNQHDLEKLKNYKIQYEKVSQTLKILQDSNNELEKRLLSPIPKNTLDILNLIRFTPGQMDKSKYSTISIEGPTEKIITPTFDSKQIHLKFNLINNSPNNIRQTGFLFVVMKTENLIQIYPLNSFADNEFQIVFNRGEVFGFNRLRFVQATFDLPVRYNKLSFKILLFDKLGDLIFNESILHENTGKKP